jgi:iron(III) transport system permease protein
MSRPAQGTLASLDVLGTATASLVVLLLGVFLLWPVADAAVSSVVGPTGPTLDRYAELRPGGHLLAILVDTVVLAAASTGVTVLAAFGLAWTLGRTGGLAARLVSGTVLLPLAAPPFFAALGLLALFSPGSGLAGGHEWRLDGFPAIVVAQVLTFLAPAHLVLVRTMRSIDPALEEAAESLGASHLTTVSRVTLALARPGLAAAASIVFILSIADFANPFLVGADYVVLATEIYTQAIGSNDLRAAAATAVVLTLPCLAACLVYLRAGWRTRAPAMPRSPAPPRRRGAGEWWLRAAALVPVLAVAAVYAAVPLASIVRRTGDGWAFSLQAYSLGGVGGAAPLVNSLGLALVAAVAGTALAFSIVYVVERVRPPGARFLEIVSVLPAALPGGLLGVGYALAFDLHDTLPILAACVVAGQLPVGVLVAARAVGDVEPALSEAAATLGAGRLRTVLRITAPLLGAPLLRVFIDFFVAGLVVVTAVVLLVTPRLPLTSVSIVTRVAEGATADAFAAATILVALVLGAVLLRRALAGREGGTVSLS